MLRPGLDVGFPAGTRSAVFNEVMRSLLEAGFSVRFRAQGHSMAPTVNDGEIITVAPVQERRVSIGDILLCQTQRRRSIAHRVRKLQRTADGVRQYLLKGDAMNGYDDPVSAGHVAGRVVSVEREGREVSLRSTSALGAAISIMAVDLRRAVTTSLAGLGKLTTWG